MVEWPKEAEEEEAGQIQALFGRGQVQGLYQMTVPMVEAQILEHRASTLICRFYRISCSSREREKGGISREETREISFVYQVFIFICI